MKIENCRVSRGFTGQTGKALHCFFGPSHQSMPGWDPNTCRHLTKKIQTIHFLYVELFKLFPSAMQSVPLHLRLGSECREVTSEFRSTAAQYAMTTCLICFLNVTVFACPSVRCCWYCMDCPTHNSICCSGFCKLVRETKLQVVQGHSKASQRRTCQTHSPRATGLHCLGVCV